MTIAATGFWLVLGVDLPWAILVAFLTTWFLEFLVMWHD